MSRSGYSDDCENWELIKWRGQVASATRGKRGQKLLREMLAALDAMPVKRLVAEELVNEGEVCALGALGQARGVKMEDLDPEDYEAVADRFDIAHQLAQEIVYENDEGVAEYDYIDVEICGPMRPWPPDYGRHRQTVSVRVEDMPARRWKHMRDWVAKQIKEGSPNG